jgi:L-amino acid N-acyltransferase YncA
VLLADDKDVKMSEKAKHPAKRMSTTVIKPPVMPALNDGWGYPVSEGNAEQNKKKNKKKSVTRGLSDKADGHKESLGNKVTTKKGWPKIRKTKKATTTTATDEDADSDNGGWGVQHSSYDPNSAAALMDWAGNWLPAPPHWETRSSFTNRNFFADLAAWIEHTEKAQGTIVSINGSEIIIQKPTLDIENETFTRLSLPDGTLVPLAEVVPKIWLPHRIEGQSLQTFWSSFIQSNAPLPIEATEKPPTKPDWQPYWTRYLDDDLPYVKTLEVPDYHLDPEDEYFEVAQTDQGSTLKCSAKMAQKQRAKNNKKRSHKAESRGQHNQNHRTNQSQNLHRPKVNIYLRTAKLSDFPQITDIYNWYVTNTVYTPERSQRTINMMTGRFTTSTDEKLNWVVAVMKNTSGIKVTGPRNDPSAMRPQQETIVGFGCADDYFGMDSVYGYAAEIELYVHPEYLHMGVGKNLMDRMMFLLDPGHKTYDAVEWRANEPEHKVPGSVRIIENVILKVPYVPKEEDQRMEWMEVWLQGFDFKKVGMLDKIGVKFSKW